MLALSLEYNSKTNHGDPAARVFAALRSMIHVYSNIVACNGGGRGRAEKHRNTMLMAIVLN